ncbi:dTMP kinase [Candidatus Uhrbacteria bacterium]|nr:dTMP kinase [Candidatus Uhrbacteria bacterium]
MHIVIEAIDGAGKGVVAKGIGEFLVASGYDVMTVVEPTGIGLGKFIREELIAKHADGRTYSGRTAAIAYSMDREQLYLERVIPFLGQPGRRAVVQDRSVLSSLVYQPVQDPSVTLEWLLSLEGNRLELAHAPNMLVVLRVDAEVAMQRLERRSEKRDNSIFERSDFQDKIAERYRDPRLLDEFRRRGTNIVEINSGQPPDKVIEDAIAAVKAQL